MIRARHIALSSLLFAPPLALSCADDPPGSGDPGESVGDGDGDNGIGERCRVTDDCPAGLFCVSSTPCDGNEDPGVSCGEFSCQALCAGGTDTQCADDDACCNAGATCSADGWCET